MLSLILLSLSLFFPSYTTPQSCNPAAINYIVRDEQGKILSEAELKSLVSALPNKIDDAVVSTTEVSFAKDDKTFYWPEQVTWKEGRKVPSLELANAATCTLHFTELTLTLNGKKMRLIFNVDIARQQRDRRPAIDSVRFQEGTFKLDLAGWQHAENELIPATRWKKI